MKIRAFLAYNFFIGLIALAHIMFLIPSKIASGGFMSLSLILLHLLKFAGAASEGTGVGIINILLNLPLFWYSSRIWGRDYLLKTVYGATILPLMSIWLSYIFTLFAVVPPKLSLLSSSVAAALLVGMGIGGAVYIGGSSGGVDILGKIINHYFPKVSIGAAISVSRILIIGLTALIFSLTHAFYSALTAVLTGFVVDLTNRSLRWIYEKKY